MDNVIVEHFLIWFIHLIWHVLLVFSKLSFLLLLILISFLSRCGLLIKVSTAIFFTGLLMMVFQPLKSSSNPHEYSLHATHLYQSLEAQLFREMCPPMINDNYLNIFRVNIMENYTSESIFLRCIYENEQDTSHEQHIECFLREDTLDTLSTHNDIKQEKESPRNHYNCLSELVSEKSLGHSETHNRKNGEELEKKSMQLTNNGNEYENGHEYTDQKVKGESKVCYDDKIVELKKERSFQDVELSRSNIEHSQVEETDMISESRSLVEETASERNGICNVISEISSNKTTDNKRKLDANESISECVEQVEEVIAVINADFSSDDMENYGKSRNSSEEVEDEDLIAVINVLQRDSDTL